MCLDPDLLRLKADFLETQSRLLQHLATDIHKAASILGYKTYHYEAGATRLRKQAWQIGSAELETKWAVKKEEEDQKNDANGPFEMSSLMETAKLTMAVAQQVKIDLKKLVEIVCGSASETASLSRSGDVETTPANKPTVITDENRLLVKEEDAAEHDTGGKSTTQDMLPISTSTSPAASLAAKVAHSQSLVTSVASHSPNTRGLIHRSKFSAVNSRHIRYCQLGLSKHVQRKSRVKFCNELPTPAAETCHKLHVVEDEYQTSPLAGTCAECKVSSPSSIHASLIEVEIDDEDSAMYVGSEAEVEAGSSTGQSRHDPQDESRDEHCDEPQDEHCVETEARAETKDYGGFEVRAEAAANYGAEDNYLPWIPSKITISHRRVYSAAECLLQNVMMGEEARLQSERAY